jgi:hypothetical protein
MVDPHLAQAGLRPVGGPRRTAAPAQGARLLADPALSGVGPTDLARGVLGLAGRQPAGGHLVEFLGQASGATLIGATALEPIAVDVVHLLSVARLRTEAVRRVAAVLNVVRGSDRRAQAVGPPAPAVGRRGREVSRWAGT